MDKKKRNLVEEIKSVKARSKFSTIYDYSSRLDQIEKSIIEFKDNNNEFNQELIKYIPISTIACFESFFKSLVKEIIDFGKPYDSNIAKFNQSNNVKLDFEIIGAIQSKSLTIGDFIAHLLSYNNYEDLAFNLSVLLNLDFTKEFKEYLKSSLYEVPFETLIIDVKKTYELRHIFCHEFARNYEFNNNEILKSFKNCQIFLNEVDDFVQNILYKDSPQNQVEININAHEEYVIVEVELETLVTKIKAYNQNSENAPFDEKLFDQCLVQWKKYRELQAEYSTHPYIGGSMYNGIFTHHLINTTKEKIISLKDEFEILLNPEYYS